MLESIEKSPTRYKITIRHLVFKGVSFQSAWHFMKHCKGMSSWAFSHGWTPPTHTCKGTSRGRLHLKLPHESQKTSISSAKCLSAEHSFSFLFTSWHGKTKSVPMNSRLQWGMDFHLFRLIIRPSCLSHLFNFTSVFSYKHSSTTAFEGSLWGLNGI